MKKIETKSLVLLQHHLKALKLPTILAECQKIAGRCATDNVDHLGFLLQLCELELIDREKRAAERRLKAARFPTYKTLENFDFAAQPSINKTLVGELMRCAPGSTSARTCCWSAIPVRARRMSPRPWPSKRVVVANAFASSASPS